MRVPSLLSACLLMAGSAVFAQQPATQTAPAPATAAPAATPAGTALAATPPAPKPNSGPDANGMYKLHDGDDVSLKFDQELSSKTASEGDPVALLLAEDLTVGGVVVAKAGCHATGEVTKAEKSGMMGKAGTLSIRLTYLKVGDTKVRLRGGKGKEGNSSVGATVALTVLFGPIGLIKHGHNIEIKQGQALKAFVDDDILLPPAM